MEERANDITKEAALTPVKSSQLDAALAEAALTPVKSSQLDAALADNASSDPVSDLDIEVAKPKGKDKNGSYDVLRNGSGRFFHRYMFSPEAEKSENHFIMVTCTFLMVVLVVILALSVTKPNLVGKWHASTLTSTAIVLVVEVLWRIILSAVAWRYAKIYKRTINYTRKLGNLLRLPKFFLAEDLLPDLEGTITTLVFMVIVDQLIYILIYSESIRKRQNPVSRFFRFLFLNQDRPEDRPNTLRFQVTEDILRFAVYIPFQIYFSSTSYASVVYIPIVINTIGDGLAEPVGVYMSTWFKKRGYNVTYTTKSLYTHEGGWWSGEFRRSYPGSACVFVTSAVAVLINYLWDVFSDNQFAFLICVLPPVMTLTEAFSPHTNDGPFIALVGCCLIWFTLAMV